MSKRRTNGEGSIYRDGASWVAAVSYRRHSWGHANRATCRNNTRSVFGSTDRNGGRAFGCSTGQSRAGQPGLAAAPFLAGGPGRSTEAVG